MLLNLLRVIAHLLLNLVQLMTIARAAGYVFR